MSDDNLGGIVELTREDFAWLTARVRVYGVSAQDRLDRIRALGDNADDMTDEPDSTARNQGRSTVALSCDSREITVADNKTTGLYRKYQVERVDGKPLGLCFVLEVDDPNTWYGLLHWADTVDGAGYRRLANDIREAVMAAQQAKHWKWKTCPTCRGGEYGCWQCHGTRVMPTGTDG